MYTNEQNQMISYNLNKAFDLAEGELFVIAGHDDRFDSNTLEIFDNIWVKDGKSNISGIVCHCRNKEGELIGRHFPNYAVIDNFFNLFADYIYRHEKFGCTRTEVLRQFKFDTSLMRHIPEGVMWGRIALKYDQIFLDETLRTYYIEDNNPSALTKRGRLKTAESSRYQYLVWANEFLARVRGNFLLKLRFHFAYLFHSFLFGSSPRRILHDLHKLNSKLLCLILIVPAWIVSKRVTR